MLTHWSYVFLALTHRYELTHLPLVPHICGRWIRSALVQIMACRLFGSKPLSQPIGPSGTNSSEILIAILTFSFKEMHLNVSSAKVAAILSRGRWVNSSRPGDTIGSSFHHVMAYYLFSAMPCIHISIKIIGSRYRFPLVSKTCPFCSCFNVLVVSVWLIPYSSPHWATEPCNEMGRSTPYSLSSRQPQ